MRNRITLNVPAIDLVTLLKVFTAQIICCYSWSGRKTSKQAKGNLSTKLDRNWLDNKKNPNLLIFHLMHVVKQMHRTKPWGLQKECYIYTSRTLLMKCKWHQFISTFKRYYREISIMFCHVTWNLNFDDHFVNLESQSNEWASHNSFYAMWSYRS